MKLLCVDTTKPQAIVGLNNDGKLSYLIIPETKRHSEALLNELENFLCENKLSIKDITALGCVTGPGSFTGIRIGMATIKAFSYALNLPIIGSGNFEVVSNVVNNGYAVLKNTSTAVYMCKITNGKLGEIEVVENNNILNVCNGEPIYISEYEHFDVLNEYNNLQVIKHYEEVMLNHFSLNAEKGEFAKSSEFAPVYAQLSQAERNLKD